MVIVCKQRRGYIEETYNMVVPRLLEDEMANRNKYLKRNRYGIRYKLRKLWLWGDSTWGTILGVLIFLVFMGVMFGILFGPHLHKIYGR